MPFNHSFDDNFRRLALWVLAFTPDISLSKKLTFPPSDSNFRDRSRISESAGVGLEVEGCGLGVEGSNKLKVLKLSPFFFMK